MKVSVLCISVLHGGMRAIIPLPAPGRGKGRGLLQRLEDGGDSLAAADAKRGRAVAQTVAA